MNLTCSALKKGALIMNKKKVAFICVHNPCRSQIAEALGKKMASEIFESYSAGTEIKPCINQDAVRLMKNYVCAYFLSGCGDRRCTG